MLPLQQLIDNVLADAEGPAMNKLAQEAKKDEKTKEDVERQASKEEAQQGGGQPDGYSEKTASAHVTSLADAMEEIVATMFPKVAMPTSEADKSVGSGKGPGAVSTNLEAPIAGTQPEGSGEAKTKIPWQPPMESKGSGGNDKAPPNAMATNADMMHPAQPAAGVMKQANLAEYVKAKAAEDRINPAKISAPKSTTLPEDAPSQMARPAEVTSQERHLQTNEAPVALKKVDAKAVPKKRMGEVLDEQALKASTDTVLDNALGSSTVDQAGAKIASANVDVNAARALLAKIASEGCTCESSGSEKGSCQFCKVAATVNKKGPEKTSQMQPAGAGSAVPSTVQQSPRGGTMAGGATTPQM